MLRLNGICKQFGNEVVLQKCNLLLQQYDRLSILGRSGSGKTSLLKIIAGLETQDSGEITFNQHNISHTAPNQRKIVYMFQDPMLFPHLSIFDNVAFGLTLKRTPEKEIKKRVLQLLEQLDIQAHRTKKPHQLSGGQQQRAAFGRAIIVQPSLILLDEPFSKLDVNTRMDMQQLYLQLCDFYKMTCIFVTHDIKEAIITGNRLAFLKNGYLKKYASTSEFLNDPDTAAIDEINFWKQLNT